MFRSLLTKRNTTLQGVCKRMMAHPYAPTEPETAVDLPDGDNAFTQVSLFGSKPEMTYGGALSFLRRKYTRDIFGHGVDKNERADIVVSGLPYDGAVTYRSGSRLGPRHIRAASVQLAELLPFPWHFDPFEEVGVIDAGDAFLDPHNPMTIRGTILNHARRFLNSADQHSPDYQGVPIRYLKANEQGHFGDFGTDKPHRPPRMLTFGGDHFVTYPLLQAHAEKYGPLALIHFDAHCDTWEAYGNSTELNHGTMFRHAAKEGLIVPEHSVQIGLRTCNDDYLGFNILNALWVHKYGPDAVLEKIEAIVGGSGLPVYLTFDIDVLDPAYAPGTGTPVPGGLTTAQALHIIRGLKDTGIDIVGADVVEVAPSYDNAEITGLAAAHVATDILCTWAYQKKQL